jgi:beta-glucosidase
VAIDHYHRYKEDVALMKEIGANAYRFSISWPRIFPDGEGKPNPKGLDFYSRLVDECLATGIEPFATLYHWDLPQALQDKYGGWQSRETSRAFGDYSGYVAEQLSDRVKHFFTLNEFTNFVELGHTVRDAEVLGTADKPVVVHHAPGLKLDRAGLNQVRHNVVLAHGLSVQAIRAKGRTGTKVGPAEATYAAVPMIGSPEHIEAAEKATRELNAGYMTVMLEGKYLDSFLEEQGADAPTFTDEDLRTIASPLDFVGLNLYRPVLYVMASDQPPGWQQVPIKGSHPRMGAAWHYVGPEVMYWGPRTVQTLWSPKEIYITENGCAALEEVAADGNVYDSDRTMYLRNYMAQLQRATAEGIPVKGNFVWTPFDNLEWSYGFGDRFGLIYVDFETQKRTPKLSAMWHKEAARRNAAA